LLIYYNILSLSHFLKIGILNLQWSKDVKSPSILSNKHGVGGAFFILPSKSE
jgi:hypothetical protein